MTLFIAIIDKIINYNLFLVISVMSRLYLTVTFLY